MKHSIRVKFTMIFIGLMAAVLVSMWAVNSFFLESFYTKQKLQLLENAYENLNAIAVDKEFLGENITEDLQSLYSNDGEQTEASRLLRLMNDKYNTTIVIQDSITGELIPLAKDGKFLADALHRYILGIIDPRTETLISQDDHQVQKIYDRRSQGYYLQSWGFFDDNRTMFIMSMPLASIHDSVSISNEFLAYVGLAALVLGSALMYYATKKELQKDIEEKIKIDETRKEFIANVSHELKTPIALIQGYAEGLTEGMAEDEDSRNYYCEVIMDEAGKMNKMVKQLLTLTALEFGNDMPVMERFDITALIRGILASAGILLQQKEARVVFEQKEPVWVWADEFKIEEVITNYLNNAMNHLDGERQITISIFREGDQVRITVFNTGQHIPEEDLDNLWTKFYKVDKARTREYGGSGIGLSIVKAIMDSHNKSCGVENVDGGVEFWFTVDSGV